MKSKKKETLSASAAARAAERKLLPQMGQWIYRFLFFTLLFGLCFAVLYPVVKVFPTVFNSLSDLGNPNVIWVPENFSVASFDVAIRLVFGNGLPVLQTLLYSAAIALIQMMTSAMIGYVLGRGGSRLYAIITGLVIVAIMVPPQALLISQYLMFKNFDIFCLFQLFTGDTIDLINQPIVLYLLAFTGFGLRQNVFVFIFRQSFKSFPKELEESALIDGCGFYRTYFRIAFPNAVPTIVTVLTLAFVWNYGDNFYTSYFNPEGPYLANTMSRLFQFSNREMVWNMADRFYDVTGNQTFVLDAVKYAGVLLYLLPLLILYFFMQKKLVENFERSGIVG